MLKHFTLGQGAGNDALHFDVQLGVGVAEGGNVVEFNGLDFGNCADVPLPDAIEMGVPFVRIDFGLRECGKLSASLRAQIPASMAPGAEGSGQSAVHSWGEGADAASVSKAVSKMLQNAIAQQATAHGLICQPAKIRYALRLKSGAYAWASNPEFVLPSPHVPMASIGMLHDQGDGNLLISVNLSRISKYAICWRMADALPSGMAELVESIDVFVSQPIATFDDVSTDESCIVKYGMLLADSAARNLFPDNLNGEIFKGRYAAASNNNVFEDHYFSETDLSELVWSLPANSGFLSQCNRDCEYYCVASLPIAQLQQSQSYNILQLSDYDLSDLGQREKLPADGSIGIMMRGGVRTRSGGRMFVAPSEVGLALDGQVFWHDEIGTVYVSAIGNEGIFPSNGRMCLFGEEILFMSPVTSSLFLGQAGQFCIYVMTRRGVWALSIDKDGAFKSLQQIADLPISDSSVICMTDSDVACISNGMLTIVSGTKINKICMPDYSNLVMSLPRFFDIAEVVGCHVPRWPEARVTGLYYDASRRMVLLDDQDSACLLAYSVDDHDWHLTLPAGSCRWGCLITQPFELDKDHRLAGAFNLVVRGRYAQGCVCLALYGSANGVSWRLLSTSRSGCMHGLNGTPYAMYRLAMFVRKDADVNLSGLTVGYCVRKL